MFWVLYCQTYTKTTVLCLIIIKKFQTLLPNSKVTDCLHIQTISSCLKFKALLKPAQTAKTNILEKRWSTRKSWGKRATVIVKRYASQWSLKNSNTVVHTLALVFFLLFLKDYPVSYLLLLRVNEVRGVLILYLDYAVGEAYHIDPWNKYLIF